MAVKKKKISVKGGSRKTGKKTKKKKVLAPILNDMRRTKIKIIGIGGGGGTIVSEVAPKVKRVDFVVANTDFQAISSCSKGIKHFLFGQEITQGLGSGMNAEIGKQSAQKETEKIIKLFQTADLSILIASLGGGTGSGSSPIFANMAEEANNITLGIFTLPFKFEGERKLKIAQNALEELKQKVNALIIISNEKIFETIDKETPFKKALSSINETIIQGIDGLIEIVYSPGLVNIDFADLKTIFEGKKGLAYLNTAEAKGPNRIEEAIKKILYNPLYEYSAEGAERILFNVVGGKDLGMIEVEEISKAISNFNPRAKIIFGISQKINYKNKIKITLLATGCKEKANLKKEKIKEVNNKPKEINNKSKKRNKRKINKRKKQKPVVAKKNNTPIKNLKIEEKQIEKHPKEFEIEKITRRNALEIKKAEKDIENEKLIQEKEWEIPAFLRRKKY